MTYDRENWEKIRRGDATAFNLFYQQNAPRLNAFLRQIVRSPQVAEDLVQDSFTQLWKQPGGYQPGRGTLRSYVFGIGRNRASEWWRQQKPAVEMAEVPIAGASMETGSVVGDAFRRLPLEHRTLLWLREVEGQSYAELAMILDLPIGTVRSRLFAAREALRKIWHNGDSSRKERA